MGFAGDTGGKEPVCQCRRHRDIGSVSGVGRYPGGGHGNPLRYSGLENSMDCTVHGVAKSQTRLITHAYIPVRIHAGEAPHSPASARVTVNTSSDAQTGCTDAG